MSHTAAMDNSNGRHGDHHRGRRQDKRLSPSKRFFKILLVTSLYTKLSYNEREPDESLLVEINDKFRIVSRLDALWIPACMTPILWKKFDPIKTLNDLKAGVCTMQQAVDTILSAIPPIGHYVGVSRDIERVLKDRLETN